MVMVRRRTNRMAWGLAASLGALAGCARDQAQRVYSTAPAEILTANWLGIHSVLSAVQSVVFSPDGKTLATGGQDCKVTLWNTATWRRERTLKETDAINDLAFSPDGRLLVVAARNRLTVRDLTAPQQVHTLPDTGGAVVFSPDGRVVATLNVGYVVRLWSASNWQQMHTVSGFKACSLAFSPNGKILAVGGLNSVELRETTTWRRIHTLRGRWGGSSRFPDGWAKSVAFSPNGKILAAGTDDSKVRLWDTAAWKEIRALDAAKVGISSVAFSPDGKWAAAGCMDATTRIWDVATGEQLRALEGHQDWVLCTAFSPDGRWLATGNFGGSTSIWDLHRRDLLGR